MLKLSKCPRCHVASETVLPDNDGELYICDECFNQGWE